MAISKVLPLQDTLKEAWNKTFGAKASIWAAIVITIVVVAILHALKVFPLIGILFVILGKIAGQLLRAGIVFIGILRARSAPITYKKMFRTIELYLALKIIGLFILEFIIFLPLAIIIAAFNIVPALNGFIGLIVSLLCFIAIIVISVRLSMATGLVVDKESNPWDAIKQSFLATRNHFWELLGIYIVFGIILLLSIIPLGIGLIWTIPMSFVLYGTVYRKLVG
jgi:hypothetical protein